MEKKQLYRIPILGIILIVLGVGLLLKQLRIVAVDGSTILIMGMTLYGIAAVVRSFLLTTRKQIFFGSLCFFSGILLLLGKFNFVERTAFVYVPGFLIVFGLAFLSLFIFNVRDFHLLVPALLFILLGIAFMMTEVGYWYVSDVKEAIGMYWPAALILFGGLLLLKRKNKNE